jgi:hypothetical protein
MNSNQEPSRDELGRAADIQRAALTIAEAAPKSVKQPYGV